MHKKQPLDRAAYGPLKVDYNSECDKWMTKHAGRRISQYDQTTRKLCYSKDDRAMCAI